MPPAVARTLSLTSPTMKGEDVRHAQRLLKSNPFRQDFLPDRVSVAFGPAAARACIRAKYWLGYPKGFQRPVFGPRLLALLSGEQELPPGYLARRKDRLRKQHAKPLRMKALERAKKDVGVKERPAGSNRCVFTERWGMVGPWCGMAVSIWYVDAGSRAFREKHDYAYVPFFLSDAEAGVHGLALTPLSQVQPGDLVAFDWEQDGSPDHIGLFVKWIEPTRTFQTIEGNTALGSNSNGGQVMRRERRVSQVARVHGARAFVHVAR
jgi:hypothetical protein